jgi:hypothetical protein
MEIVTYKGNVKTTKTISNFQTDIGRVLFYFSSNNGKSKGISDLYKNLILSKLSKIMKERGNDPQIFT